MKILVVDDEQMALTSLRRLLYRRGLRDVEICDNGETAISRIKTEDFDLVLLDLLMPGIDGLQVLETTKPEKPRTEFIILTAVDDVSMAVRTIRLGAYDYLVKPVDHEKLILTMERAFERRGLYAGMDNAAPAHDTVHRTGPFGDIITVSSVMHNLLGYAQVMARSGQPFLITGESGTGKELMARGIHRAGPNPDGPFIAVNVTSFPDTLFDNQFFGHTKGAFTGAVRDYPGFFEQANGGTLFLDEIGELPVHLQVKLLRVLEEQNVVRLGETTPRKVNVRIISATNEDLEKACQEKKFRLDLLYRLKSAYIHLPSLQERPADIPLLACHFLQEAGAQYGKKIQGFSDEAMQMLMTKKFPGNIRELKQLVEHAVCLCEGDTILPHQLGERPPVTSTFARRLCSLKEDSEAQLVYVLTRTGGSRRETARILGVSVRQVQRLVARLKTDLKWKDLLKDI